MDFEAAFAAFLVQDDLVSERLAPELSLLGVAAAVDSVIFIKGLSDVTGRTFGISVQAVAYEFLMAALFEDLFLDCAFVDLETEKDRLVLDVPEERMKHAVHFDCSMGVYYL